MSYVLATPDKSDSQWETDLKFSNYSPLLVNSDGDKAYPESYIIIQSFSWRAFPVTPKEYQERAIFQVRESRLDEHVNGAFPHAHLKQRWECLVI